MYRKSILGQKAPQPENGQVFFFIPGITIYIRFMKAVNFIAVTSFLRQYERL